VAGRPVPRPGEVRLREVSRGPWHCALQPETSRLICRIFARRLISTGRDEPAPWSRQSDPAGVPAPCPGAHYFAHGILPFWATRSIGSPGSPLDGGTPPIRQPAGPPSPLLRSGRGRVWLALARGQPKHGCAAGGAASRPELRAAGAQLRQRPNLCRGRLRDPAVPVQPRPLLLPPPRLGPGTSDPPSPPHDCDVLTRARPRIILWWTRRVRLWRRVGCGRGVGARGDHGAVAPVVRPWRVRGTPLMATGVRPQLERASVPELPGAHRPGRSGPRGIVGRQL
jgi:hypothetical protein